MRLPREFLKNLSYNSLWASILRSYQVIQINHKRNIRILFCSPAVAGHLSIFKKRPSFIRAVISMLFLMQRDEILTKFEEIHKSTFLTGPIFSNKPQRKSLVSLMNHIPACVVWWLSKKMNPVTVRQKLQWVGWKFAMSVCACARVCLKCIM